MEANEQSIKAVAKSLKRLNVSADKTMDAFEQMGRVFALWSHASILLEIASILAECDDPTRLESLRCRARNIVDKINCEWRLI